ncbi:hypothetical protein FCG40_04885 [Fimbriimonadia bacterium ATM]|nr:MAG: hypothetical protein EDM73_08685 [Armatimonadota bacterium]MBC6969138.1 hypothetical protein [Armatimonadota bacterium]MCE7900419.1 hypothetical protein [Armatimonadetes bacterium ATM1]MDL1928310.1 hypothetical protein [Fimbriimonadia bacterium ATM]RIJ97623.1 MAG: hypothetical protein DCC45_02715 [Armatimonadota bacterium]
MVRRFGTVVAAVGALGLVSAAKAQPGWDVCFDPTNTQPISVDWNMAAVGNAILVFGLGVAGTVTWGPTSPCGVPPGNDAQNVPGYLMIRNGSTGSALDGSDQNCAITMGAPWAGNNWSYATIRVIDDQGDTEDTKWGADGFDLVVVNASFRRLTAIADGGGGVTATLLAQSVGDAIRFQWDLTNTNATPVQVGLRHASWLGMLNFVGGASGWNGNAYVQTPTGRPIVIQSRYTRATNPLTYPKFIDISFRQSLPYPGLRIPTGPDPLRLPDQTQSDELVVGEFNFAMGGTWTSTVLPDALINNTAFCLFYNPVSVAAGGTRRIVYYVSVPWAEHDLNLGVDGDTAIALETPPMIAWDNPSNSLDPNPFEVVLWVDNQYGRINEEQEVTNVNCTIQLPPGVELIPGEQVTKVIASIPPRGVHRLSWFCETDGTVAGPVPIRVTVTPNPGRTKTIESILHIAASPQVSLVTGPQLIGMPWQLANANWAVALGLSTPADFTAFNWDVVTQSYVTSTTAARGRGTWILATNDFPAQPLTGATSAGGEINGNFPFLIRRGWNLVANPYLYSVQLNTLNAISSGDPTEVLTWTELTQRGWIRGTVFRYDTNLSDYTFSSDSSQLIPPGVGYWIYANISQPMTLYWPPIFLRGLPGSPRSADDWRVTTDRKWRLQLVVRGEGEQDVSNYVGVAPSVGEADNLSAPEPPARPGSAMRFGLVRQPNGDDPINWTQDIREARPTLTFNAQFMSTKPGTYSITWPNISQLPRNVRVRLVDKQNGQTRDMRQNSAYTFTVTEPIARNFDVIIEPGSVSRPVIGNVTITSPTRDRNAPITIQYGLSAAAEVSVRILGTNGREVYTISRGRAENPGVNTATWLKRDNQGRAVAPGNYMVEIVAQTAEGQRVRVTRPVVVVR